MRSYLCSKKARLPLLATLLAVPFIGLSSAARAETPQTDPDYVVNSVLDTDDMVCGVDDCTLREAINAANATGTDSVISFDPVVFAAATTIQLGGSALPTITSPLTINGTTAGVIVNGNFNSRVFMVSATTVSFNLLSIINGQTSSDVGTGLFNDGGTVIIDRCTISGNASVAGNAGGILNNSVAGGTATVTITNSTLNNNSAGALGGGVFNFAANNSTANMSLTNCTLYGNSSGSQGGGAENFTLDTSTANLTITNCTFSANSSASGDSIHNGQASNGPATTTIGNTILSSATNNLANGGGTITSADYNIANDDQSAFLNQANDQNSTNPLLDPNNLQDNGGPTQTIALQGGSPAIDTGNTALTTDQRGITRPQGIADDVGAYEAGVISVATTSVTETNAGTVNLVFTLTLSAPTSQTVTVDVAAAPGITFPATGGGVDYDDYSTTVTFAAGETTKTVNIGVNGDTLDEFNERVALVLTNPTNADIGTVNEGIIIDDDPAPSISINDVQVTETNGGSAQAVFTLTLSAASAKPITVIANTNSLGGSPTATPGSDYTAVVNKTITFAPGTTTQPFNVTILGDVSDENDEKFGVRLTSATNATIADNSAVGTILDNDNPPVITGQGGNITEGDGNDAFIFYSFNLSAPSGKNISLSFKTTNATTNPATAGTDYTPVPAMTITIPAGSSGFAYPIAIKGDLLDEVNERIGVQLSNVTNATVGTLADIVIVDNDATPSLSIADAQTTEGDSGTKLLTFTVTLSAASGQTVTVNAQTSGGGSPAATAGSDYVALASTPISFAPGQTSKQISVTINGDTTVEANEKFGIVLSGAVGATIADNSGIGTITNDDAAGVAAPEAPSGGEDEK